MKSIPFPTNEKSQKEIQKGMQYLKTPCTVAETVQIAREVAQEVLTEDQQHTQPWQVAVSIQVEILKKAVIDAGLITEEKFREEYVERMTQLKEEMQESSDDEPEESADESSPKMAVEVNDITVEKV